MAHAQKSWIRAIPLTNNRVHLTNTSLDYISAWPIDFGSLKHIAFQDLTSIYDLWRMTEDENITSIIMLMPVNCNGEDRCARYYPRDVSSIVQIGNYQLTLLNGAAQHSHTEARELQVLRDEKIRTV